MTDKSESRRPSQVTMAGWVALVGSLLMVLSLFEAVPALQSVDFRNAVGEFLATPPGNGLGVDTAEYVDFLRQLMFFSGAAGAAAAVFAVFVLQRHKAARVGLTVAAGAIMLATAPFTSPPMADLLPVTTSAVVIPLAFAAILLWSKPARDWYAGRPVTLAQHRPGAAGSGPEPYATHRPPRRIQGRVLASESHPPQEEPGSEDTAPWPKMPEDTSSRPLPPPTPGFGTPPGQAGQYPGQAGYPGASGGQQPSQGTGPAQPQAGYPYPPAPYGEQPSYAGYPPQYGPPPYGNPQQGPPTQQYAQPYYGVRPSDPHQRPATVTVAAAITWLFSGLALVGLVITAARIPTARDEIVRQLQANPEFQRSGFTVNDVVAMMWVMIAVSFLWAVAAIVLAWFAFRRANWARITLVVSAAVTALFSLLGVIGNPVLLLGVVAAGSVVTLLFSGGANQWYSSRPTFQGHPGPFQPYGAPQQYAAPPQGYTGQAQQYTQPEQYGGPAGQPGPQGQGRPQYGSYPGQQGPTEQGPAEQGPAEQGPAEESRGRGKDEPPRNVW